MSTLIPDFEALVSDEVLVEGMLASDVRALWRRLARCESVRRVAREIASDVDRLKALCRFIDRLLEQDYDRRYRHPHDIAVCAALVLLEQSPLSDVRRLLSKLRRIELPSLRRVRRMAEYCDERYADAQVIAWGTNVTSPPGCFQPVEMFSSEGASLHRMDSTGGYVPTAA